jgi:ankyrin repeat protein
LAIIEGQTKILKIMIRSGADPETDCSGVSPVILASTWNRDGIIKLLIQYHVDLSSVMEDASALRGAVSNQNPLSIMRLLRNGADPNVSFADGRTVLHHAAEIGPACHVNMLIDFGAIVNTLDENGNLPINYSANSKIRSLLAIHS